MDRFRDLYSKMAQQRQQTGRDTQMSEENTKQTIDAKSLRFITEAMQPHAEKSAIERFDEAMKQYKAEVDQTLSCVDGNEMTLSNESEQHRIRERTGSSKQTFQRSETEVTSAADHHAQIMSQLRFDNLNSSKASSSLNNQLTSGQSQDDSNPYQLKKTHKKDESYQHVNSTGTAVTSKDVSINQNSLNNTQNAFRGFISSNKKGKVAEQNTTGKKVSKFNEIHAHVIYSTTDDGSKRGDVDDSEEIREVSFSGLKTEKSPRNPQMKARVDQKLQPVIQPRLRNSPSRERAEGDTIAYQAPQSSGDATLNTTEESKRIEDYMYKRGSVTSGCSIRHPPGAMANLDLIKECAVFEEKETARSKQHHIKNISKDLHSSADNQNLYESGPLMDQIKQAKQDSPNRFCDTSASIGKFLEKAQSGKSSVEDSREKSRQSRKNSRPPILSRQSSHSGQGEKQPRIRSSCQKMSQSKKSRGRDKSVQSVSDSVNYRAAGSEPSAKNGPYRKQRTASIGSEPNRNDVVNERHTASPQRFTPLSTDSHQQQEMPARVVDLQKFDPRDEQRKDDFRDIYKNDPISIEDQSNDDYQDNMLGKNQDSFGAGYDQLLSLDDPNNQQNQAQYWLTSGESQTNESHEVVQRKENPDADLQRKISLNHEKLDLQRKLDDMCKAVMTFSNVYSTWQEEPAVPKEIKSRSHSREKPQSHRSVSRGHQAPVREPSMEKSPIISARENQAQASELIQSSLRQYQEGNYVNTTQQSSANRENVATFRPNPDKKTDNKESDRSNEFVRNFEERSREAIRQSQAILQKHRNGKDQNDSSVRPDESPPKPRLKSPRPELFGSTMDGEVKEMQDQREQRDLEALGDPLDDRYMRATSTIDVAGAPHGLTSFRSHNTGPAISETKSRTRDVSYDKAVEDNKLEQSRANIERQAAKHNSRGASRDYSREAQRIMRDQNRIVSLLNIQNRGSGTDRGERVTSRDKTHHSNPNQIEVYNQAQPLMTDRTYNTGTERMLKSDGTHQQSYTTINKNLQRLRDGNQNRDEEKSRSQPRNVPGNDDEVAREQQRQREQSREANNARLSVSRERLALGLDLVRQQTRFAATGPMSMSADVLSNSDPNATNLLVSNREPAFEQTGLYTNNGDMSARPPNQMTQRSNATTQGGIETFCKKRSANFKEAISEKEFQEIHEKSETLCRQMNEAKENRMRKDPSTPVIVELKTSNEGMKNQVSLLEKELAYYKSYAKEKQNEIFELSKKNEEIEEDLAIANNPQLFSMYKTLKDENVTLSDTLKSSQFSSEQQKSAHAMLQEQYEKLKQSQISLLDMNKSMLVNHQREVQDLSSRLEHCKEEIKGKNHKLEVYQDIMKSFNGQISEFENFQQNSERDMKTLTDQFNLYKELYDKEKQQKKILVAKLRAGKLKVPHYYSYKHQCDRDEINDRSRKLKSQDRDRKRSKSSLTPSKSRKRKELSSIERESVESKKDVSITYLSSNFSEDDANHKKLKSKQRQKPRHSSRKRSRSKPRAQVFSTQRSRSNASATTPEQTFRKPASQRKRTTPTPRQDSEESQQANKEKRNSSRKQQVDKQKKAELNTTKELGLRSNFAKANIGIQNQDENMQKQISFGHGLPSARSQGSADMPTQGDEEHEMTHGSAKDRKSVEEGDKDESTMLLDCSYTQRVMRSRIQNNDQDQATKQGHRGLSQDHPPVDLQSCPNPYIDQDQSYNEANQDQGLPRREYRDKAFSPTETNEGEVNQRMFYRRQMDESRSGSRGNHGQGSGVKSNVFSNSKVASMHNHQVHGVHFEQPSVSTIQPYHRQCSRSNERNSYNYNSAANANDEVFSEEIDPQHFKTTQQLFRNGNQLDEEGEYQRHRSSSLHRKQRRASAIRNKEAARIMRGVSPGSLSAGKGKAAAKKAQRPQTGKPNKLVPMSTKDYYIRLKDMQNRLERARQDIQENLHVTKSRSRSNKKLRERSHSPNATIINVHKQLNGLDSQHSQASFYDKNSVNQQRIAFNDQSTDRIAQSLLSVVHESKPRTKHGKIVANHSSALKTTPSSQHVRLGSVGSKAKRAVQGQLKFRNQANTSATAGIIRRTDLPMRKSSRSLSASHSQGISSGAIRTAIAGANHSSKLTTGGSNLTQSSQSKYNIVLPSVNSNNNVR